MNTGKFKYNFKVKDRQNTHVYIFVVSHVLKTTRICIFVIYHIHFGVYECPYV